MERTELNGWKCLDCGVSADADAARAAEDSRTYENCNACGGVAINLSKLTAELSRINIGLTPLPAKQYHRPLPIEVLIPDLGMTDALIGEDEDGEPE